MSLAETYFVLFLLATTLAPVFIVLAAFVDRWAEDRAEELISYAVFEYEFDNLNVDHLLLQWAGSFVTRTSEEINSPLTLSNVLHLIPNHSPRVNP